MLAVSARIQDLLPFLKRRAVHAWFLDLDDPEGHPLPANYRNGNYVYLLGARPGRWTVVALGYDVEQGHLTRDSGWATDSGKVLVQPGFAWESHGSARSTAYVPKKTATALARPVAAGEAVFLGELTLGVSSDWENESDAMQRDHASYIAAGYLGEGGWGLRSGQHEVGSEKAVDTSEEAQRAFEEHAREVFANTDWAPLLRPAVAAGD